MRHKRLVLGTMIAALLAAPFAADAQRISTSGAGAQAASAPVVQQPGDANATILNTSTNVITGALTATRTWTLPAASTLAQGREIKVTDVTDVIATPGNNIIIAGNGTDTINGRLTFLLSCPGGSAVLQSNGVNGWAASADACDIPNAANNTAINSYGVSQGPLALIKLNPVPLGVPGAGVAWLFLTKGTNAGTCKLVVQAGLSTTLITIVDNIPGGGFAIAGVGC